MIGQLTLAFFPCTLRAHSLTWALNTSIPLEAFSVEYFLLTFSVHQENSYINFSLWSLCETFPDSSSGLSYSFFCVHAVCEQPLPLKLSWCVSLLCHWTPWGQRLFLTYTSLPLECSRVCFTEPFNRHTINYCEKELRNKLIWMIRHEASTVLKF